MYGIGVLYKMMEKVLNGLKKGFHENARMKIQLFSSKKGGTQR